MVVGCVVVVVRGVVVVVRGVDDVMVVGGVVDVVGADRKKQRMCFVAENWSIHFVLLNVIFEQLAYTCTSWFFFSE